MPSNNDHIYWEESWNITPPKKSWNGEYED